MKCARVLGAVLVFGITGSAWALPLENATFAFSTSGVPCTGGLGCAGSSASFTPEGLAFNTAGDTLLVAGRLNGTGATYLYQFNQDGTFTNPAAPALFSFNIGNVRGLDYIPASNTVLASAEVGFVREYTLAGAQPAGGIDFLVAVAAGASGQDVEGVVLHPNGNIYVSDDEAQLIRSYSGSGATWVEDVGFQIDTDALDSRFDDPSSLQVDPTTGNLIVHDDSSGGFGSIWEISLATRGLVTFNHPITGLPVTFLNSEDISQDIAGCNEDGTPGCRDGEGIAYDPETDRYFIAYENEALVITYPRHVPEPSAVILLLTALAAVSARRRR
jgi:uncharacterized protein YjiK